MSISAYPLQWPTGWPRTKHHLLKHGKFTKNGKWVTLTEGTERVLSELGKMGINRNDIVISTNVRLRLDGLPRSGEKEPEDSGAAVYWEARNKERRVMAIDQYSTVADNLAAIAATLDAMRAIERHGGAQILDRAFTGFTALPAPNAKRHWSEVMGFGAGSLVTLDGLKQQYRRLASLHHPDKGGDAALMSDINQAYAEAQADLA